MKGCSGHGSSLSVLSQVGHNDDFVLGHCFREAGIFPHPVGAGWNEGQALFSRANARTTGCKIALLTAGGRT